MKKEFKLKNWAVIGEQNNIRLAGTLDDPDRPRLHNENVVTSHIVAAVGNRIETRNSIYILEENEVDPEYVSYLRNIGYPFDIKNPVKMLRSEAERFKNQN